MKLTGSLPPPRHQKQMNSQICLTQFLNISVVVVACKQDKDKENVQVSVSYASPKRASGNQSMQH